MNDTPTPEESPPPRPWFGPLSLLTLFAAGVDRKGMARARSRSERKIYSVLGSLVLLTVALAWVGAYFYVSYSDIGELRLKLSYALVASGWAGAILLLDRALVSLPMVPPRLSPEVAGAAARGSGRDIAAFPPGLLAEGSHRGIATTGGVLLKVVLASLPRVFLALVVAYLVAEPFVLWNSRQEIDDALGSLRASRLKQVEQSIRTGYAKQIEDASAPPADADKDGVTDYDEVSKRITEIQATIRSKDAERVKALNLAERAEQGAPTANANGTDVQDSRPGCGKECRGQQLTASGLDEELKTLREQLGLQQQELIRIQASGAPSEDEVAATYRLGNERACELLIAGVRYGQINLGTAKTRLVLCFPGESLVAGSKFLRSPLDGVLVRQEIIDVLTDCKDPFGIRTPPAATVSPKKTASESTDSESTIERCASEQGRDSGDIRNSKGTVARFGGWLASFVPKDTAIGRRIGYLRLLLVTIDTLPIVVKGILSVRLVRPYESWAALERSASMDRLNRKLFGQVGALASDLSVEASSFRARRIAQVKTVWDRFRSSAAGGPERRDLPEPRRRRRRGKASRTDSASEAPPRPPSQHIGGFDDL